MTLKIGGKTLQEIIEMPRAQEFIRQNGYSSFGMPLDADGGEKKFEVSVYATARISGHYTIHADSEEDAEEKACDRLRDEYPEFDIDDVDVSRIKESNS